MMEITRRLMLGTSLGAVFAAKQAVGAVLFSGTPNAILPAPTGVTVVAVGNFPTVLANVANGTVLANLFEQGGTGSGVSFAIVSGSDASLGVVGSQLIMADNTQLVPGTSPTYGIKVTDSGGSYSDASNARSFTCPAGPTTITLNATSVAVNIPAGGQVGMFGSDGTPPLTFGTPSNNKFQEASAGSAILQRSSTGTLTQGVNESINQSVTDAAGLTTNTATNGQGPFSLSVTAPASIPSIIVQNTSGSTVAANSITPIFGMAFARGDITAPAPIWKVGGTTCKFSMSKKVLLWDDGSLRHAAFMVMIPSSIAGNGFTSLDISDGGMVPSPSSRTTANYTAGGTDLRIDCTGLDNLTGAWSSTVADGITSAAVDNYVFMDGDCGRVDRIRASFKQSGTAQGYLECYHYLAALQDNSGALYGLRWFPRIAQPWFENNLGPGGSNRIMLSFSALAANNGGTTVLDLASLIGGAQSFSIAAAGNSYTATGNTLLSGQMVRLTGGSLPPPLAQNTSYVVNHIDSNHINIGTDSSKIVNGGSFVSATGAGSGTATAYPYLPAHCSLWGCRTDGTWNYIQGAGSVAADTPLRIQFNQAYLQSTGLVPNYDVTIPNVISSSSSTIVPNGAGPVRRSTGDTGDRLDIGVLHAWGVRHLYTQAAVDEQVMRIVGLAAANFPWCVKSKNAGATLLCLNNGHGGTGSTYSGMHAPQSLLVWDGVSNDTGGGITNPANTSFMTSGVTMSGESHIPAFSFYPFIVTGWPMFQDMMAEQANFAVSSTTISTTAAISLTQYLVGKRNPVFNGHNYYGTVWNSLQQRNGAWGTRDLACAAPWDYPECASYKQYLSDMSNDNAGFMAAVIAASPNSFTQTAKIWFSDDPGIFNSLWQEQYLMQSLYLADNVTKNSDYHTAYTRSVNWFDYGVQNCTAYVMATDQSLYRKGNVIGAPLMDNIGLFGAHLGLITGWDAGGYITIQGQSGGGGPNTPVVPGINDGIVFLDADLGSGVPPCRPVAGGLSGSVPYYVVAVQAQGGVNYGVKVATSKGGAAISLTNDSHGAWNGWIAPLTSSTGTLHITNSLTGTIWASPPSNTYVVSGAGIPAGCQVTAVQATAPGDVATYTVNKSVTIGSSGSPIAMTGKINQNMINWYRPDLANIPATASYDSGITSYLAMLYGNFNLAVHNGITVSSTALSDLATRAAANGISSSTYGANPKFAWAT